MREDPSNGSDGWRRHGRRSTDAITLEHAVDLAPSPFPPIGDYAFLSDCETVALVGPTGAVEWMCLPRVDSPSVFGAILDRDAGTFRLGPEGISVPAARHIEYS